ncbi:MAG: hypothetical protein ACTSQK_00445 [Candidatus Heimdallarchaeota archaeon]
MRENHFIWFITSSVLGILIIIWASIAPSLTLVPGDIWMLIPGIILVFIGLLGIMDSMVSDRILLKYISKMEDGRISLFKLSTDLNQEVSDLREIILTLRGQGKLKVFFDEDTGEVVSSIMYQGITCSLCGEPITTELFCSICGTEKLVEQIK